MELWSDRDQVVTQIVAKLPDVVSLMEQINTAPGTWCAAIDLANMFFLILVNKRKKGSSLYLHGENSYLYILVSELCQLSR